MKILGIDPGTNSVGVALWDSEKRDDERGVVVYEVLDTSDEVWALPAKATWIHRVKRFGEMFSNWLWYRARGAELVVFELPTRNHDTCIKLAVAGGWLASQARYGNPDIEPVPIPAQYVKSWLGIRPGTRREIAKSAMRNYVNARFGLALTEAEQDAADALVIAMAGWHYWKEEQL